MNKILKVMSMLFVVTIITKGIGFLRETTLVAIYGASMVTDAYIVSTKIPSTIYSIIEAAISTTFIPIFCEVEKSRGKKESLQYINNTLNIVILLGIVIGIMGYIFSFELVKIFAMNFEGEKLKIAVELSKITVLSISFAGINNIYNAYLQVKEKYNTPQITIIIYNLIIIASIIISKNKGVVVLAVGTLIAIMSQSLINFIIVNRLGCKYRPYIDLKDENIKKMLYLLAPVIIGVAAREVNIIIDTTLASTLGDGVITILNGANKIDTLITSLFISTTVSIMYPIIAKLSNEKNKEEFIEKTKQFIKIILVMIIPISVGVIVLSTPIVRVIFERGEFKVEETIKTANTLRCYALGMLGVNMTVILNKIYYSIQDTKTPMISSVISIIINIVLNISMIKPLGHIGLALATSISSTTRAIILYKTLNRKLNVKMDMKKIFIKALLASSITAPIIKITYNNIIRILSPNILIETVAIVVSLSIGTLIYILLLSIMKIKEDREFISLKK